MFKLKNLLGIMSKRTYRKRLSPVKSNPGINQRLKLYKEQQADLANVKLSEESLDKLEEDVYSSSDLHSFHSREVKKLQNKILLKQIERKHFTTQKLPNMLLWAEKEQIRLLWQSDPDLWTPEKLSQSFPTTPDIILKILKSQWKPANNERIKAHDQRVSSNWEAFEVGKLNLPDHLASHLKLFTSRRNSVFKEEEKLPANPEPKSSEFADIVRNYTTNNTVPSKIINGSDMIPALKSIESDTYVFRGGPNSKRRMKECTLEEAEKHIHKSIETNNELHSELKKNYEDTNVTRGYLNESAFSKSHNDIKTIEIENSYQRRSRIEENIGMKIEIPKEKWKKGCIYKINNCYYADDGEFLYRV